VQQREYAQKEVERLLNEARERAADLAGAKDVAEKAAAQNEKLFESEQVRRRSAEALARSARQLSSLSTQEKLPQQILEQLQKILHFDRAVLIIENDDGVPGIRSHFGFPKGAPISGLHMEIGGADFYETVARKGKH